jgi:hypothetical protein
MTLSGNYTPNLTGNGSGALRLSPQVISGSDPYILYSFTVGPFQWKNIVFRITAGPDWQHHITKLELSI